MVIEFDYDHPLVIEFDDFELRAWQDTSVPGSIIIKVNCQEHDIEKWRKNGAGFIATQKFGEDDVFTQEELISILFLDPSEWSDSIHALFKKKHSDMMSTRSEVAEWTELLNKALDAVELILRPEPQKTKARTRGKALPAPKNNRRKTTK